MKKEILELLRQHRDTYVSGEDISHQLKVSRTAIWKHIQSLRKAGYLIDSSPRHGYRLRAVPDILYPEEVQNGLSTKFMGHRIFHYHCLQSTNETARVLAEKGAEKGTIILSEEQLNGRGRLGRNWVSPYGRGIWMSIILKPTISPIETSQLTLVAGVAVTESIRGLTGLPALIKWPNDILINNKKVCGILTESKVEIDVVHYVIIGIGINVNLDKSNFPEDIRAKATSLKIENGGNSISRVALLQQVLSNFEHYYLQYLKEGFGTIRHQWKKYSITFDRYITIQTIKRKLVGLVLDIDQNGALVVRDSSGKAHHFNAGEITLNNLDNTEKLEG